MLCVGHLSYDHAAGQHTIQVDVPGKRRRRVGRTDERFKGFLNGNEDRQHLCGDIRDIQPSLNRIESGLFSHYVSIPYLTFPTKRIAVMRDLSLSFLSEPFEENREIQTPPLQLKLNIA